MNNQPKQYQQGWTEFYKLKFAVNSNVLIPRPETELLVDEVLHFLKGKSSEELNQVSIVDIGTGSGCIAISIAKNAPQIKVVATDISDQALEVARKNAQFHGVERQIEFIKTDLIDNQTISPADIIVTNLPYIPTSRIPTLDGSVKDYEPLLALDGGPDGFDLYRKLFEMIKNKQWKPKLFIAEIDQTQGKLATKEALEYFPTSKVQTKEDLAHQRRILIITQ